MALMAALEADLRALSAESRRRHPAVKDAAEHAILKLRSLSSPKEIAQNDDILRIFLMACDVKSVKLSVIGLSCLQKLVAHDAVALSALKDILSTLKDHAEMTDESVQLKTLQTTLIIFQSQLLPRDEDNMAQALGICLRLLEGTKSSDSVRNTAAATFRQAVALVFDAVAAAESLPSGKAATMSLLSRVGSVTDSVTRSFHLSVSIEKKPTMLEDLTREGKLGIRLLEDLTALAAGGSAVWLKCISIQRIFALDIIEFVMSNYVAIFRTLLPYEQVLRHQICSLLMTSLRTNTELEGEAGEPTFRRLVLRSVAHIIRLYSSSLVTESEVFLNMLVKVTRLDLPLWHRILVLEILRGFCVEACTLRLLFQTFDMNPKNTNVVENMVRALALVVSNIQMVSDSSEESLAAVAGMFSSKAKGIEWSMDNDASNSAVLVASEAHAITLAIEGLLGVVFTIATLTDEAMDTGELASPKEDNATVLCTGQTFLMCTSMVSSTWLTILDALSFILTRSQGEAIILEILKGYQAFTQACGVLGAVEPLNSFLASLCKFTISIPTETERRSNVMSPGSKKVELVPDQPETIVLTPKNVQALRTLFNVAHRLHNVLGPSWSLVLETLAALDRAIHSPYASTQEVSTSVSRMSRESSGQYSDFHILSSLNSQLFESSALMNVSAVKSLLSALRQLSSQYISGQNIGSVSFSVQRMTTILVNNLNRVEPIWDQIASHLIELCDSSHPKLRSMALEALDQSICAVLSSDNLQAENGGASQPFECAVLSPLIGLYTRNKNPDVHIGALKILLHVLERCGEKLYHSWSDVLQILRAVADTAEKDHIPLGFQSIRVIMNEELSAIPLQWLDECMKVTGAYGSQKEDLNISLTAIGLLWTATDFIAKGIVTSPDQDSSLLTVNDVVPDNHNFPADDLSGKTMVKNMPDYNELLFSVFSVLQNLGADERPEVRNSAIRTLFQTLSSHGQKISRSLWEDCLRTYVFPILDLVSHLASTSSKDEWQGKELGTRGGKAVHMLIHHSRNTAQKQWDETIVLVLGGIARLLRSFFPLLRSLHNFSSGWEHLLEFVKNSILYGSKEVALAAISCLQTIVSSHCPKGNLEASYIKSMLDIYELVLQTSPNYKITSADKVKQEILHGLGDLYFQAQSLFDADMYMRLTSILHTTIRNSKGSDDFENEMGNVSPVQRTVLELIPKLRPTDALPTMWSPLLHELLCYVIGLETSTDKGKGGKEQGGTLHQDAGSRPSTPLDHSESEGNDTMTCGWSPLFVEKLLPIIVDLYVDAPPIERFSISPELIKGLGRSMNTRRDNPTGSLWRISLDCFNKLVADDVRRASLLDANTEPTTYRLTRGWLWKEVADVYEIFLVGSCGRALTSDVLKADELLEMNFLKVLGENVLKSQVDAPVEILERLVTTLDRCASRTGSLPLETVGLLPPNCSRFSLSCLQMMFSLCSCTSVGSWPPSRSEVSKVSIIILMKRCEVILNQFLKDENALGESSLPGVRTEEVIFVLQELARLIIHPATLPSLPLPPHVKEILENKKSCEHAHLLVLFPSLCELVVSREARVRELVRVLLRLISSELGLQHLS
ncbi:ARM repeat superfamily protein [Rhynchospora pubera]|uniref:ARM repeat superfamily protein n=1 Tax=Rhynchospora pubera TaxID=906938 RepID=A0AAV8HN89_9POAL|nr:ARM repeat superfamily protein [Rhynchospora pubera]